MMGVPSMSFPESLFTLLDCRYENMIHGNRKNGSDGINQRSVIRHNCLYGDAAEHEKNEQLEWALLAD